MFTKLIKFYSFIRYIAFGALLCDIQWKRFQYLLLKAKPFLKKLGYRFLGESTKIENATFPYKTATSEASVKTNRTEIHKWTYHKEQKFASNYFQKQSPRDVLRNFAKFTGKHLHQSLRCAGLQLYLKKETLAQMFSCEFWETSKNTFFTEHLRWLLLYFIFFKKNWFQFMDLLHKKLFLCTNDPNVHINIFRKRWNFI